MLQAVNLQSATLDLPTLSLVAILCGPARPVPDHRWMQQRNVRALAWWGSAYLIGASGMALGTMPTPVIQLPPIVPGALTFLACGMIWNGVRHCSRAGECCHSQPSSAPLSGWELVEIPGAWTTAGPSPRRPDRPALHVLHRDRTLAGTALDALFACRSHRRAVPARGNLSGAARHARAPACRA